MPALLIENIVPHSDLIAHICRRYIHHEFDLLGSGWVENRHGMVCRGIEGYRFYAVAKPAIDREGNWLVGRINRANLPFARKLWSWIDPEYKPIDWQLDFRSGYRWDESVWYKNIVYGVEAGADVKIPWELARMQHLVQLALASFLSREGRGNLLDADVYRREFENQILDFIATNPPRFGVNWSCTMDVAIRAVNWLVAYDLFRVSGAQFADGFEQFLVNSIYDHGDHIAGNLEYSVELRGNHYLSNISGLLFVAAYLPATNETDTWLSFALRELYREARAQFYGDGSNFEASTSYHRLSTEILVYSVALICGIPENRIDGAHAVYQKSHQAFLQRTGLGKETDAREISLKGPGRDEFKALFGRIEKAIQFTLDMTAPSRQTVQIGDNDNGRFLKLQPAFHGGQRVAPCGDSRNRQGREVADDSRNRWAENSLDHRHLISAANGLLQCQTLGNIVGDEWYEESIIKGIANSKHTPGSVRHGEGEAEPEIAETEATDNSLCYRAYPGFGVYVYRSADVYLVIRCGPIGQNGQGGHAHNDQLSVVAALKGRLLLVDPGSYAYTSLPERRNLFRSTGMHNTLSHPQMEQNDFRTDTLFAMEEKTHSRLLSATNKKLVAEHHGFGVPHRRSIEVEADRITVDDYCPLEGLSLNLHLHPSVHPEIIDFGSGVRLVAEGTSHKLRADQGGFSISEYPYSQSYGAITKGKKLTLSRIEKRVQWQILMEGSP